MTETAIAQAFEKYWSNEMAEEERDPYGNPGGLEKVKDAHEIGFEAGWSAALSQESDTVFKSISIDEIAELICLCRRGITPMVRYGNPDDMQRQAMKVMAESLQQVAERLEAVLKPFDVSQAYYDSNGLLQSSLSLMASGI